MPVKAKAKREQLHIRLTASEKALYQAAQDAAGYAGSADIWRGIFSAVSELTLKLKDNEITLSEFSSSAGEAITNIVVPGVLEQQEHEKKDDS